MDQSTSASSQTSGTSVGEQGSGEQRLPLDSRQSTVDTRILFWDSVPTPVRTWVLGGLELRPANVARTYFLEGQLEGIGGGEESGREGRKGKRKKKNEKRKRKKKKDGQHQQPGTCSRPTRPTGRRQYARGERAREREREREGRKRERCPGASQHFDEHSARGGCHRRPEQNFAVPGGVLIGQDRNRARISSDAPPHLLDGEMGGDGGTPMDAATIQQCAVLRQGQL